MSAIGSNPGLLPLITVYIGPVIGVFVIWQIIKLFGMEYWIRVPRQSRLTQWGQNGLLFFLFIVLANLASYMVGPDSQSQSNGLMITLNMILGTLFLFGVVASFMQSWIDTEWVRWTVENYPQQHREILLFASRGEERRKWRQNKEFEDFRDWVQSFVQNNIESASGFQEVQKEIPLQSLSKIETLLEKLPLIVIGGFSVLLIVTVIWIGLGSSFYFSQTVHSEEIGVQFKNGSIQAIVGPGTYSDVGKFVHLQNISCKAIPFNITDNVTTQEKDAVILTLEGSIFRVCNDQNFLEENWVHYADIFINDDSAYVYATSLVLQAVDDCVGSYKYSDDIFEDGGITLRDCLDEESNKLVGNIGLRIENVVISEIR